MSLLSNTANGTSTTSLSPILKNTSTQNLAVPLLRLQKMPSSTSAMPRQTITNSSPMTKRTLLTQKQQSTTFCNNYDDVQFSSASTQPQIDDTIYESPLLVKRKFYRLSQQQQSHGEFSLTAMTSRENLTTPYDDEHQQGVFRNKKTQNQLKSLLTHSFSSALSHSPSKLSILEVPPLLKQNSDQSAIANAIGTQTTQSVIQASTHKLLSHKQSPIKPKIQNLLATAATRRSQEQQSSQKRQIIKKQQQQQQQEQLSNLQLPHQSQVLYTKNQTINNNQVSLIQADQRIKKSSSQSLILFSDKSDKQNSEQHPQLSDVQFKGLLKNAISSKFLASSSSRSSSDIDCISPLINQNSETSKQLQSYSSPMRTTSRIRTSQVNTDPLQTTISNVLPISLPRFLERSYKQNTLILRHGIAFSERTSEGPRISVKEAELYNLFQRVISNQQNAIKLAEDQMSSLFTGEDPLEKRVDAQISDIVSHLQELLKIKNTEQKTSTVFAKFFESLNYLIFGFYETETISTKIIEPIFTSAPFLGFTKSPAQLRQRLFHENFSRFFFPQDFKVLIHFVVIPDLLTIKQRIEVYLSRFYQTHLQTLSENIHETAAKMFEIQQQYLYSKSDPRKIASIFSYETPAFARTSTNTKNAVYNKMIAYQIKHNTTFKKSESQFSLHGQLNNYSADIRKSVSKYEIISPYSDSIDPSLKSNIIKMYNTLQTQP